MAFISDHELQSIADALDIEGGSPCLDLVEKNAIWANVVLIFDTPTVTGINFDDLLANNQFPLLENIIEDINEAKLFATYLMVIGYLIENGRQLTNRLPADHLNVTIHIHQDGSLNTCQTLRKIVKKYVEDLIRNFKFNVNMEYRVDDKFYINSDHNYKNTHVLISLSQSAGLGPKLKPGELIIPNEFIPFNVYGNTICMHRHYKVNNVLTKYVQHALNSKFHAYAVEYVTKNYVSGNPNKHHTIEKLTLEDFNFGKMLQANGMWLPRTNPDGTGNMVKICGRDNNIRDVKLIFGTHKVPVDIIVQALKIGVRAFDTATAYANAVVIGRAIRETKSNPVIITKFTPTDLEGKLEDIVESHIKHLGQHPDIALIHTPLKTSKDNIAAFKKLWKLLPHSRIGVSNFNIEQLDGLIKGGCNPYINSIEFNPYYQPRRLIEYCEEHGIIVTGYRTYAKGQVFKDPVLNGISDNYSIPVESILFSWYTKRGIIPTVSCSKLFNLPMMGVLSTEGYEPDELTEEEFGAINALNQGATGSTCMLKYTTHDDDIVINEPEPLKI